MVKTFIDSFYKYLSFLFVYYSVTLLGWEIVSFIYLYHSMDEKIIDHRFKQWMEFEPYLIITGIIITLLFFLIKSYNSHAKRNSPTEMSKQATRQLVLSGLLLINYLLYQFHSHLDLIQLLIFFFGLWVLIHWGSVFYSSDVASWNHPTTHGTFFVSALLNGCALLSIFSLVTIENTPLKYYLLILLFLELLIVYARFQYLSRFSQETNLIARKLMGPHLLYFGMRIILGIFMPAIFIIYTLFTGAAIQGVEALIFIGTLLDKWLFMALE